MSDRFAAITAVTVLTIGPVFSATGETPATDAAGITPGSAEIVIYLDPRKSMRARGFLTAHVILDGARVARLNSADPTTRLRVDAGAHVIGVDISRQNSARIVHNFIAGTTSYLRYSRTMPTFVATIIDTELREQVSLTIVDENSAIEEICQMFDAANRPREGREGRGGVNAELCASRPTVH